MITKKKIGDFMGYGLDIRLKDSDNEDFHFYGTKLYGYAKLEPLLSYQYLKSSIGKEAEEKDIWDYEVDHEFVLTADDFQSFIHLYEKDFEKETGIKNLCNNKEIQNLLNSDEDKVLSWG